HLLRVGWQRDRICLAPEVATLGGVGQVRARGAGQNGVGAEKGRQLTLEGRGCGGGHGADPNRPRNLLRMAKIFDVIDEQLERWIFKQSMFFVGSAPLDADGQDRK